MGLINVFTGPMKCGKTSKLISIYEDLNETTKYKCMMFKPLIDDRFATNKVVSRDGTSVTCVNIKTIYDLIAYRDLIDIFFIDEFQFIEGQDLHVILNSFVDEGKKFYIAGLNLTAERKPFGNMPQLLALADEVEYMEARCDKCGKPAIYTYCKQKKDTDILIGDSEYLAVCSACYKEMK